jgi:hypothetical protein
MLHAGPNAVSYDDLRAVQLPARPTRTFRWLTTRSLSWSGTRSASTVTRSQKKAMPSRRMACATSALCPCAPRYGDYTDTVGLRNSNERTFALALPLGAGFSSVTTSPSLATRSSGASTPGATLTDEAADHAIMDMDRKDITRVQAIGHVLKTYDDPPHDWSDRTAWRLFNAATFALAGKVAERPDLTKQLHQVIDGTCERLHCDRTQMEAILHDLLTNRSL